MPPALATIRTLVCDKLQAPAGCLEAVQAAAQQAGLSKADPAQLWSAICRVRARLAVAALWVGGWRRGPRSACVVQRLIGLGCSAAALLARV